MPAETGGRVHPTIAATVYDSDSGITRRGAYACAVIASLLSQGWAPEEKISSIVKRAYMIADEMITYEDST